MPLIAFTDPEWVLAIVGIFIFLSLSNFLHKFLIQISFLNQTSFPNKFGLI